MIKCHLLSDIIQIPPLHTKISILLLIFCLFVADMYAQLQNCISNKTNVHFALDIDSREQMKLLTTTQQRTISPLPISNATKYKSDSNPNLQLTPVPSVGSIHTSHNIIGHNILTVDIFNKELLKDVFNLAESLRNAVRKERPLDHILRVKTSANDSFCRLFRSFFGWINQISQYTYVSPMKAFIIAIWILYINLFDLFTSMFALGWTVITNQGFGFYKYFE